MLKWVKMQNALSGVQESIMSSLPLISMLLLVSAVELEDLCVLPSHNPKRQVFLLCGSCSGNYKVT